MEIGNTTNPVHMYNYVNSYVTHPFIFFTILAILVLYILSSLGTSEDSNGNGGFIFGGIILIGLVILFVVNALHINVTTYIQGLFSPMTKVDVVVDHDTPTYNSTSATSSGPVPIPEMKFKKQVFNIPGNYYTYDNAKALCTAYGAKLATYEEIEKAYNSGAEWCNYGWSANQLALFPTQQKTYNTLQLKKGHEHACGRPGINGGYIANPEVKFGVNCFGNKPIMTGEEEHLMQVSTPYPETAEDLAFQQTVNTMKANLSNILVSPFNYKSWS